MTRLWAANAALQVRDEMRNLAAQGQLEAAIAAFERAAAKVPRFDPNHPLVASEVEVIQSQIRERDEALARAAKARAREEVNRQRAAAERARLEQLERERLGAALTQDIQRRLTELATDPTAIVPGNLDTVAGQISQLRDLGAAKRVINTFEKTLQTSARRWLSAPARATSCGKVGSRRLWQRSRSFGRRIFSSWPKSTPFGRRSAGAMRRSLGKPRNKRGSGKRPSARALQQNARAPRRLSASARPSSSG